MDMRITEYERGYNDAMRRAISWIHAEALQMNDPHARRVLDLAASSLGAFCASVRERERVEKRGQHPLNKTQPHEDR
jgi:hypothetical protein